MCVGFDVFILIVLCWLFVIDVCGILSVLVCCVRGCWFLFVCIVYVLLNYVRMCWDVAPTPPTSMLPTASQGSQSKAKNKALQQLSTKTNDTKLTTM